MPGDPTTTTFRLVEFNPRRHARKAPAASVRVFEDGEPVDLLWMTPKDIRGNLANHPGDPGLAAALAAYTTPTVRVDNWGDAPEVSDAR